MAGTWAYSVEYAYSRIWLQESSGSTSGWLSCERTEGAGEEALEYWSQACGPLSANGGERVGCAEASQPVTSSTGG